MSSSDSSSDEHHEPNSHDMLRVCQRTKSSSQNSVRARSRSRLNSPRQERSLRSPSCSKYSRRQSRSYRYQKSRSRSPGCIKKRTRTRSRTPRRKYYRRENSNSRSHYRSTSSSTSRSTSRSPQHDRCGNKPDERKESGHDDSSQFDPASSSIPRKGKT